MPISVLPSADIRVYSGLPSKRWICFGARCFPFTTIGTFGVWWTSGFAAEAGPAARASAAVAAATAAGRMRRNV